MVVKIIELMPDYVLIPGDVSIPPADITFEEHRFDLVSTEAQYVGIIEIGRNVV